jgi:hypothetical protein
MVLLQLLVVLDCLVAPEEGGAGHVIQQVGRERELHAEGDGVEALQAEQELVKQKLRLLVNGADEGVALVEAEQHVHAPLQFGEPDVQAGHAKTD